MAKKVEDSLYASIYKISSERQHLRKGWKCYPFIMRIEKEEI
jgi:hypothetical protein